LLTFGRKVTETEKYSNMKHIFVLILGFLFFLPNCSQPGANELASVGGKIIDRDQFHTSFALDPVYRIGDSQAEALRKQLRANLNEKYFALGAEERQMDTIRIIRDRIAMLKTDKLAETYNKIHTLDPLTFSEKALKEAFVKNRKIVHLRHLFSPDSATAAGALDKLKQGTASFDALAGVMFRNERLKQSGGSLGQCYFGELEPALEEVAFRLKAGEIHDQVVKSSFGYHVLKAEEITIRYIPSESNYGLYKKEAERVLRKRKYQKLRAVMVRDLTADKNINIAIPAFEQMHAYFSQLPRFNQAGDSLRMDAPKDDMQQLYSQLQANATERLVSFGDKQWTIEDFLYQIYLTPPFERPQLATRQDLYNAIRFAVLDDIIADKALSEGLDTHPHFERLFSDARDKLLAREYRYQLGSDIRISDSSHAAWFAQKFNKEADLGSAIFKSTKQQNLEKRQAALIAAELRRLEKAYPAEINYEKLYTLQPDTAAKINYHPSPVLRKKLW
jgi:hypothetical protein